MWHFHSVLRLTHVSLWSACQKEGLPVDRHAISKRAKGTHPSMAVTAAALLQRLVDGEVEGRCWSAGLSKPRNLGTHKDMKNYFYSFLSHLSPESLSTGQASGQHE